MEKITDKKGCFQFWFFIFCSSWPKTINLATLIIHNLRRLVMSLEIKQTIKELNQKLDPFKGYL
jgi:hypothetical protein